MSSRFLFREEELQKTDGKVGLFEHANPAMLKVYEIAERVAPTDLSVLITGESGAGKEMIARRVHEGSPRRDQAFVKINSAAIPNSLLESELFGYQKGAFTGANRNRKGLVEEGHQGTVFFDEIAELGLETQTKLLQILHDKEFTPLGSNIPVRVDIRILAATNRNLQDEVALGRFREDLYYRLNVVHIQVPALRECQEDIRGMFDFFWDKYTRAFNRNSKPRVRDKDFELLHAYDWPGNVRELENFVKKLVLVRDHRSEFELLRRGMRSRKRNSHEELSLLETVRRVEEEVERKVIARVLKRNGWNRKKTAEMLQISYRSLLSKIKKLEIE